MLACRAAIGQSPSHAYASTRATDTPRPIAHAKVASRRCHRAVERGCVPDCHVPLGCRFVRKEKEKKETVSTIRSLTDGRCTGYQSDWPRPLPIYFLFTRSTLGHSRRPHHCNSIKRSSTLTPHGCVPHPPPPQVLQCQRSPSSPSLLHCSSPPRRLPPASRTSSPTSHRYTTSTPLMSIPWAVLINPPVIFLRLERPNISTANSHDRSM